MTTKFVVTDEQEKVFHRRRRELENRLFSKGALNIDSVLNGLQLLLEGYEVAPVKWYGTILERERQCHIDFFGREFDLHDFERTLKRHGQKKFLEWQKYGFEPHYLPETVIWETNDQFPGLKYNLTREHHGGRFMRKIDGQLITDTEVLSLRGTSVLVDTLATSDHCYRARLNPKDSLIGPLLAELRDKAKVEHFRNGFQTCRGGVSAREWHQTVRHAIADELQMAFWHVRLELFIEAMVIPQMYPHMPRQLDEGGSETLVWLEEYTLGSDEYRFVWNECVGNDSSLWSRDIDVHDPNITFRPLIEL